MTMQTEQRAIIAPIGVESLASVEKIMQRAFDPRFGEAWTKAQCLATLALPGYRLRGARLALAPGQDAPHPSDGDLVGFAIERTVAGESELLLLAVDPAYRRHGVGRSLMNDWLDFLSTQVVGLAFLEMRSDNPARFLYESLGFKQIGLRPAYYRGGDGVMRDAVTMHRPVKQITS